MIYKFGHLLIYLAFASSIAEKVMLLVRSENLRNVLKYIFIKILLDFDIGSFS